MSSVQLWLSNPSLNLDMLENSLQSSVWQIIFKRPCTYIKKKEKETLSPIWKQQSKHFKQACFITIIIVIIIQYKPTWSLNYQKQKQTENTLLQHIIQGLLSCDVNYLYYNSAASAEFITIMGEVFLREKIKYQIT